MDSEEGSIIIGLPGLFRITVVADMISSRLSDDDLRFLYGTCRYFRHWSSEKLAERAGGEAPRLAYTEEQLHTSPQTLKLSSAMLYRHKMGLAPLVARCAYGHAETYKFLHNSPKFTEFCKPADDFAQRITFASEKGYFKVLEYLLKQFSVRWGEPLLETKEIEISIAKACENGHLAIAKWLCEACRTPLCGIEKGTLLSALMEACANRHTDTVFWMHKTVGATGFSHEFMVLLLAEACACDHPEIRDWICESNTSIVDMVKTHIGTTHFLEKASITGHLHAIEWWDQKFKISREDIAQYSEAGGGHTSGMFVRAFAHYAVVPRKINYCTI
jgi:hypothetical protein